VKSVHSSRLLLVRMRTTEDKNGNAKYLKDTLLAKKISKDPLTLHEINEKEIYGKGETWI
jgi:hypothetical protein